MYGRYTNMDYKVPARAYIKKSIKEGRKPLLPNYVGHIKRKPVYEEDGTLDSMDDILVRTERGVREVATEKWGEIKGYPPSWGTTAKDRRWIIQDPRLHFWSVLGDAFAPSALKKILDLTVLVGLICHLTKLKPPTQIHIFVGFCTTPRELLR
jgi:hypothetical protein